MALKPYKTPKSSSETEFTINKSRFIGRCFPVESEEAALLRLEEVRRSHSDASHNCWAYSLRSGANRFSDDGEPGGTAGMPIMDTLLRSDTQDALIVVTRYFGGILLGSGGLVRAYSRAASDALNAAGSVLMVPCSRIQFSVEYPRFGGLEGFVRERAALKDIKFAENVAFVCLVEHERADEFISDIINRTDGRSRPEITGEEYLAK